MKFKSVLQFIICLAIPLIIGGISGYITKGESNGSWFTSLEKPSFNPPNYVFGPVWTTLYLLMGISFYLIYQTPPGEIRTKALIVFCIQLSLNFLWSILFFSLHLLLISVIDIIVIWLLIIRMITLFHKIKLLAGYLQLPYLLWITFATVLDGAITYLNR